MRVWMMAAIAAVAAGPALAQVERLPSQSRAERQVNDINRSLAIQQQQQREDRQSQFEVNQLRGEIQRNNMFPPAGRICPPGSINC